MPIQTPPGWIWDQLSRATMAIGSASPEEYWHRRGTARPVRTVNRIGVADLRDALALGFDDFMATRTDVVFLGIVYPILGLILARAASGQGVIHLLFPLASGFALIGPFAAIGLNEMSRRREQGDEDGWTDAFGVLRSPSIGSIMLMGLLLVGLFLLWLAVADQIYRLTLGPRLPVSMMAFVHDVFTTGAGWTMIAVGIYAGFLFAVLALSISVVSFPLLLDRNVGLNVAVATSVRAVLANPGPMALWGLIVAGGLLLGSLPLFLGLIVVLPVLGHATWHLYRKVVPPARPGQ
jgi:uncharacterized membrane protein